MKVAMTVFDEEWEVRAYGYPDMESAREVWARIQADNPEGDFSCWSTTTPDGKFFAVILCGRAEAIEDVEIDGELIEIAEPEAHAFCARRLRAMLDADIEGRTIEGTRVKQIASYEGGKRLEGDGTLSPYQGGTK